MSKALIISRGKASRPAALQRGTQSRTYVKLTAATGSESESFTVYDVKFADLAQRVRGALLTLAKVKAALAQRFREPSERAEQLRLMRKEPRVYVTLLPAVPDPQGRRRRGRSIAFTAYRTTVPEAYRLAYAAVGGSPGETRAAS